jgi:hypothetical protein
MIRAFASKKSQTVTARLIVRRVHYLTKQAAAGQADLFRAWRYHAVFTDSPARPAGDRITVRDRTKTAVKDKLGAKHTELAAGVRTPANYSVEQCLKDWQQTLNTQAEHCDGLPDHGQVPGRDDRQRQARRAQGARRGLRAWQAG